MCNLAYYESHDDIIDRLRTVDIIYFLKYAKLKIRKAGNRSP